MYRWFGGIINNVKDYQILFTKQTIGISWKRHGWLVNSFSILNVLDWLIGPIVNNNVTYYLKCNYNLSLICWTIRINYYYVIHFYHINYNYI